MGNDAPGEGGWYSQFSPEPIDIIEAWGLPHHEASILQYVVRHKQKGGVEDLLKARWYLDRLIAMSEPATPQKRPSLDTPEGFLLDVREGYKSFSAY